jgi:predicted ATPase
MLTRLKVSGFKNLLDVDIHFGPFTCIAGGNGVGKSNLFDAIQFLSALADTTLVDAALSVRGERGRGSDVRDIFFRYGETRVPELSLLAEMLVKEQGVDDLGQAATAAITFVRYEITLALEGHHIVLRKEQLDRINLGEAYKHLPFPHKPAWRKSVVSGRRTSPFLSTESEGDRIYVALHQDQGEGYKGGGRKRHYLASTLPRTVLSTANAAESSTAVLVRREIQSWSLLQLEPSALRAPDAFTAPRFLASNGAHLPATLARLARLDVTKQDGAMDAEAASVYAEAANRLAELVEGVDSLRVDVDPRREMLTLVLKDLHGTSHEARSLSDGTLRFLALAVLEQDPLAGGVLCMEEPENGIHPERIPAMNQLLMDYSVDSNLPVDGDNPLRQVVVNTHSPLVAAGVPEDSLLFAEPRPVQVEGRRMVVPSFRCLSDTWRARLEHQDRPVSIGHILSYLQPSESLRPRTRNTKDGAPSRVIDRQELQPYLPFGNLSK